MQKQEIPPLTLCHSGSDLALNQLVLLQAISRPPWRLYECSLNSRGSSWTSLQSPYLLGGCRSCSYKQDSRFTLCKSKQPGWHLCFHCCEVSCLVWSGRSCSTRWQLHRSNTVPFVTLCSLPSSVLVLLQRKVLFHCTGWKYQNHYQSLNRCEHLCFYCLFKCLVLKQFIHFHRTFSLPKPKSIKWNTSKRKMFVWSSSSDVRTFWKKSINRHKSYHITTALWN